jgi:prolyl-tRNA editing enzyme YbaK/EbsC (Cys-tRNA(Pro) deacylase)
VVIDQSAQNFADIHISGGQRGLNIRLPVADLATLVGARFGVISTQDVINEIDE